MNELQRTPKGAQRWLRDTSTIQTCGSNILSRSVRLAAVTLAIGAALACSPRQVEALSATSTATGTNALDSEMMGYSNSAFGTNALTTLTDSAYNTAVGDSALRTNNGSYNTAVGYSAMYDNTTGSGNTAVGMNCMSENTTGTHNSALGLYALQANLTGSDNTGVGWSALWKSTASDNTGIGYESLKNNTSGTRNIALGSEAGSTLTTGSDNIDIGHIAGSTSESATIRLGTGGTPTATYIAGISGQTSSSGVPVYVNTSHKLGTVMSSARFKQDIRDMGASTNALMKLRPVRFHYKKDIDPSGLEQYGLVAEEVAKVYPDLVTYDDKGQPETVRYHFINAMLLNQVQKQEHHIAALERRLQGQTEQLAALTAQVQVVARADQLKALTARLAELEAAADAQGERRALEVSCQR